MKNSEVKSENNSLMDEIGALDARVYEVGYLLVPNLSEEDVPTIYGNLKELVSSFSKEMISDEMPKMITLAYTMEKVTANVRNKFNTAYFGWVKFIMDPDKILELKKKLSLDANIIRFLIVKTVKENTIAAKRFMYRDNRKKMLVTKEDTTEEAPINEAEIDKEIEAMVAV